MSFEQIIHHLEKKEVYVTLGMSLGLKEYCSTTLYMVFSVMHTIGERSN